MAIITRRYVLVGPTDAMLDRYVDPTSTVSATYPTTTLDIDIDNTVADVVLTLDEYMTTLGFVFSATAGPRQVFQYLADGTESNPFTIGVGEGFLPRVTANYGIQVTLCYAALGTIKVVSVVGGSMTVSQFDVDLSASLDLGDLLMFTVEDLT